MMTALASRQCGLGSIPAQYFMWVEFVVVFRLASRVFLRVLWSKGDFQSTKNSGVNCLKLPLANGGNFFPVWKTISRTGLFEVLIANIEANTEH